MGVLAGEEVARDGQHSGVVTKLWLKVTPFASRSRPTACMTPTDCVSWWSVVATITLGLRAAARGRGSCEVPPPHAASASAPRQGGPAPRGGGRAGRR